jgi:hypothetical protein
MTPLIAINWTVFSLTLIALFLFGILYALLVNWLSRKNVIGQTASLVVGGVSVGLIASIPTFGLTAVAILFSYYAACGLPMVIEYGLRVHQERVRDVEAVQALAKEAINQVISQASDQEIITQADANDQPA